MGGYAEAYRRSLDDPEGFWGQAAQQIDWYHAPATILDASNPPFYRWFSDGAMNTCFNALDRHVARGRGDQAALIYDSPVTGVARHYTYAELLDEVATFAGVLACLGVERGDRVVIYMPMIPQAVVAMLACARIGAVHSVVFGGFAAHELAVRIDDARPTVVVSASCGIEVGRVIEYKPFLDRALELATHKPVHCVILQRPQARAAMTAGRDLDWDHAMTIADPADCAPVAATDPLYILYTSGTTARPKGVRPGHDLRRTRPACPGPDRRRRRAAPGGRGGCPAEDPFRQDPAPGRCAALPTGRRSPRLPPSRTPRCSTRYARSWPTTTDQPRPPDHGGAGLAEERNAKSAAGQRRAGRPRPPDRPGPMRASSAANRQARRNFVRKWRSRGSGQPGRGLTRTAARRWCSSTAIWTPTAPRTR
jgi:hypothetical protein